MAKKASKPKTWVALFRAVNVGGKNKLPMAKLREGLTAMGLGNVRTYIQSGNVIFQSSDSAKVLSQQLCQHVLEENGFETQVLVIEARNLAKIVEQNPFPTATEDPSRIHCYIWERAPKNPNLEEMDKLKSNSEAYQLVAGGCFIHAPDGVARSKLFAKMEKLLGVDVTARNYKSLSKILELAQD